MRGILMLEGGEADVVKSALRRPSIHMSAWEKIIGHCLDAAKRGTGLDESEKQPLERLWRY